MTISVGVTAVGSGGGGTATTSGGTTNASGSTFYAVVIIKNSTAVAMNLSDAWGNTYTQIGSTVSDSSSRWLSRYQCVNGVGGSGHTLTATESVGTDAVTVYFVEIVGGATITPLDQSNTYGNSFAGNPTNSGSITLTPSANSELLISTYVTEKFAAGLSYTEANGFTVQALVADGTTGNSCASAIGTQVVASPGSYSASWTCSSGGSSVIAVIDSFQGGGGGGGGGAIQNGAMNPGQWGPQPGIGQGGPNFIARRLATNVVSNNNVTVGLTGLVATFSGAPLSLNSTTTALVGQAATFAVGTVVPTYVRALAGVAGTYTSGSMSAGGGNLTAAITGAAATFAGGTLIPSVTGMNITLNLVGIGATFAGGTLVPSQSFSNITLALVGRTATFASGMMGVQSFNLPAMDLLVLQNNSAYFK